MLSQLVSEVLTHILAFLLFFWVIRKWAWGPIQRFLDERRNVVEEQFRQIESKEREAQELRQRYEDLINRIDEQSRQRLNEAIAQGHRISQEITEKARADAREISDKARRTIQIEMDQARIDLKNRMIDLTLKATERMLNERLDEAKHRELISHFVDDLGARQS